MYDDPAVIIDFWFLHKLINKKRGNRAQ